MKYKQLSKKAQAYCLAMQKKFNFKKLTDQQIIEKIKNWDFNRNGTLAIGLN